MTPEKCSGCGNNVHDACVVYKAPEKQWSRLGGCPMRTHNRSIEREQALSTDSIKVSKRKMGVR